MTAVELAEWTRALFTGEVVSAESAEAIAEPGFDLGDGRSETRGWVAHDESLFGTPFLGTAGGGGDVGHNVVVVWVPDLDRVVAVASNGPEISAEELLAELGPALLSGDPLPTPPDAADEPGPEVIGRHVRAEHGRILRRDVRRRPGWRSPRTVPTRSPRCSRRKTARAEHEAAVLELLAGRTQEGQEERAALEQDIGPIEGVEVIGTATEEGERRTYVRVTSADQTVLGWYALNSAGGIEGATLPTEPPAVELAASGDSYEPADPTGDGPEVTVVFGDGTVTVTGPGGPVDAVLVG